jgi:MFS transporter, DHA3 family, macrolide efflux protein
LGRSAGMMQTAQAVALILPPMLAGALLAKLQFQGIILIDCVTYVVFAVVLLPVQIRRPLLGNLPCRSPLVRDIVSGWSYIKERRGLLALLVYFAGVNLSFGTASVLLTPLILSFSSVKRLGAVLAIAGVGFLFGSIFMSVWGGPKHRVLGILRFGALFGLCVLLLGVRPQLPTVSVAAFGLFFCLPLINGLEMVIWQTKVPLNIQGRVIAFARMAAMSTIPMGYLLAGPLVNRVFEPLVARRGVNGQLRWLIGEGGDRSIGLLFVVAGGLITVFQLGGYLYPGLRLLEHELPDVDANRTPA